MTTERQGTADAAVGRDDGPAADVALLRSLGYSQELQRRMTGFSNFAVSFSVICILAGGITSLQLGVSAVGGAAAGILWPIGAGFALVVALCMAQIASAFPTAGGLYHWSAILGGKGWGWATAWLNLAGLVFVTAAVNVGTWRLLFDSVGPVLGIDLPRYAASPVLGASILIASQALCNTFGIRLTALLIDFSGYLILVVAVVLVGAMLHGGSSLELGRLWRFQNYGGEAGGGVWPAGASTFTLALQGLLWPVYTITGFDGSAHASEETVSASRNVPRGILRSVYVSGICGWVMVASFVLAMPDVTEAARQGDGVFAWLMQRVVPGGLGRLLWVGVLASNYLCGLACVTSTSRMIYAFARDGGLPASDAIRKVSPTWRTPVRAIWVSALLVLASTAYAPAYETLSACCVLLLYLSYVMPTLAGYRAIGKTWTKMGAFDLGARPYKALAVVSGLGVALLLWIGVRPPNEKALVVLVAAAALIAVSWWLGVRKIFRGPPVAAVAAAANDGPKPLR